MNSCAGAVERKNMLDRPDFANFTLLRVAVSGADRRISQGRCRLLNGGFRENGPNASHSQ